LPKLSKFTRKNLFLRDQHECQYCSKQFVNEQLTIDHVIPRSLGGGTSWTNCVAACKKCNGMKGNKLMKPIREAVKPTWHALAYSSKTFGITVPRVEWLNYVDWPEEHVRIAESHGHSF
jgi:5-methylcytosine-specific restriction endonuclease McrA